MHHEPGVRERDRRRVFVGRDGRLVDPHQPSLVVPVSGTSADVVLAPVGSTVEETSTTKNGVIDPNEHFHLVPRWRNAGLATASAVTGSIPSTSQITSYPVTVSYPDLAPGVEGACSTGGCYGLQVASSPRPGLHWDVAILETMSTGDEGIWRVHMGRSFWDVESTHWAYSFIETLLHNGVTTGTDPAARHYDPGLTVPRDQMAVFLARVLAGGDAAVPASGSGAMGAYDCTAGGTSLFADVDAAHWACRHIHYIFERGVTQGCPYPNYCPASVVSRDQMAAFVARAMAGGDAAVPMGWTNPANARSYDCGASPPVLAFSDVPAESIFCKHIHYLWATEVISGCDPGAGKYCPSDPVYRDQMAKFITNGFHLTLY